MLDILLDEAQRVLLPYYKLLHKQLFGAKDWVRRVQRALLIKPYDCSSVEHALVGLHGMGGIGKTALALAVYDDAVPLFPGRCVYFSAGGGRVQKGCNADECCSIRCALIQSLLGAYEKPAFADIRTEREALFTALCSEKLPFKHSRPLLLILDDLSTREQLHWLLACDVSQNITSAVEALPAGSRVLLISRDPSIVTVPGVVGSLIRLEAMDDSHAVQLLCQEASSTGSLFPQPSPKLTKRVVDICGGLPLALRTLGRQLRCPHDDWQVRISHI